MLIPKYENIVDKDHLRFIASLPCLITGWNDVQAAHIRKGNNAGMAYKSGDNCAVPLSVIEHAKQHSMGDESKYWDKYGGIDKVTELANNIYKVSGNRIAALRLIYEWRLGWKSFS